MTEGKRARRTTQDSARVRFERAMRELAALKPPPPPKSGFIPRDPGKRETETLTKRNTEFLLKRDNLLVQALNAHIEMSSSQGESIQTKVHIDMVQPFLHELATIKETRRAGGVRGNATVKEKAARQREIAGKVVHTAAGTLERKHKQIDVTTLTNETRSMLEAKKEGSVSKRAVDDEVRKWLKARRTS